MPLTRCTEPAADLMNTGSGSADLASRSRMIRRPVAQVVRTVKLTPATSSGNQPPSATLVMFDAKKMLSTMRNSPMTAPATIRFQRHTSKTSTPSMMVVISIVPVTAIP